MAYTDLEDDYVDQDPRDGYERPTYQDPASYRGARGAADQRPSVMPAHPLPKYRSGKLDYDRYLEASSNKFKIFSAESRRQRNKAIATGAAIAALVVIIVIWAVLSK